jgi:alcohol dehydrogenase (cytochrome c)
MRYRSKLLCGLILLSSIQAQNLADGRQPFTLHCAGCHGWDGRGGEHAPNIVDTEDPRARTRDGLKTIIREGIPGGGMPAFPQLSNADVNRIIDYILNLRAPAAEMRVAGDPRAGAEFFFGKGNCAPCHMVHGRGGILGPDLSELGRKRRVSQVEAVLETPVGRSGQEGGKEALAPHASTRVVTTYLRNGQVIRGLVKYETTYDLLIQDLQGGFHSLSKSQVARRVTGFKPLVPALQATPEEKQNLLAFLCQLGGSGEVPVPGKPAGLGNSLPFSAIVHTKSSDWPTYNGQLGGNRYTSLKQINVQNISRLAPKWSFPLEEAKHLEVTPVVVDGVMYVTRANEVFALDARTGVLIWHYSRPRTKGIVGDAAGDINRGVAVEGDRLFMVTDNAHLISLNRFNGGLIWDVEMADYREHYGATSAPLVVNDLVISGPSGGDEGARGFIDAYRAVDGEHVWRVWTMPKAGEPLAKTWTGSALEHGCAAAWFTGSYDPETGLIFWPTGNPCPDYNGDERRGDNLYSSSVLAIEAETGKIRWYYQYTPHDVHDWDAAQTQVLVDAVFHGSPRKLLLAANRNGFFYVLDRETGKVLLAKPFTKALTWASGIDERGRPQLLPGAEPTPQGTKACPSVVGATNWFSPAFNPETGLFYVQTLDSCGIYIKAQAQWIKGQAFYGGSTREIPGEIDHKFLRAIDIQTGRIAWEDEQFGKGSSWGGVLATAGGVIFFCDDSGAFAAVDARTGARLWHFYAGVNWHASPMSYVVNGKQYVAVAAGSNILAFSLP